MQNCEVLKFNMWASIDKTQCHYFCRFVFILRKSYVCVICGFSFF